MKKIKKPDLHIFILFGALVLAFSFRLIRLGAMPLFDSEAEIALEALSMARQVPYSVGPFPAVVGLTGFDFLIFKPGNFLARFWSAAFSSLIVLVPFLFRKQLGLWGATLSAVALAVSPEMVGPARLIGTPMMAMVCLLLSLGFLNNRKPILAGGFAALGLMSGPGFWFGAVILGASFLLSDWLFELSQILPLAPLENKSRFWLRFGLSSGMVILVIGTGFFMAPQGLSGIFSGLVLLIRGIFQAPTLTLRIRLLSLIAYAAGALVFGLWGGIRGALLRNKLDLFLFIWTGLGLVLYLFYPGGQPSYLAWVTFPLWLLAARAFVTAWRSPENSRLVVVGTALLVIVVSAFMLLALRSLIRPELTQNQQLTNFIGLLGGLILMVAVVLLINFGWAEEVALAGLLNGVLVVLLSGLVAVSVNTTSLNPEPSYELWLPEDQLVTSEWLQISIEQVQNWNKLRGDPVEIAVADFEKPAMVWALRDYAPVDFIPYPAPQSRPGILISNVQAIPEISSAYRGQDLVWTREVLWHEMTAIQYLDWLITRHAPTQETQIILWVRTDLMPDEQFSP